MLENVPEEYKNSISNMVSKITDHMGINGAQYKWDRKDFQIGAPLGKGQFGRVFLAREKTSHYLVAMKVLYKSKLVKFKLQQQILREIEINFQLRHPHLIRLFTYFTDEKRIYIIFEFAGGGDLYKYVQNRPNRQVPESTTAKYIDQIADAIDYCHKNNVIHRDIKLENVLLTVKGDVKLADFGCSVHSSSCTRKTMCGTIDYLAPEMMEGKEYDEKIDLWSIGVVCYELIVGDVPVKSKKQIITINKNKLIDIEYPSFLSDNAKNLISNLLQYEPKNRLHPYLIRKHPWITHMKSE